MDINQRMVTIFTPGKIYSGYIDIANESQRTIDIFNSANVYWKDPNERSFDDSLLLRNASIVLEGNFKIREFSKLQIKISDILFFYDSLESLGNILEQKRAAHLNVKTKESASLAHMITHTIGDAFFYITGTFYGLFKSKSKHRFIPITDANVVEIIRCGERWQKKQIPIEGGFVGISTHHIEACTFSGKNM